MGGKKQENCKFGDAINTSVGKFIVIPKNISKNNLKGKEFKVVISSNDLIINKLRDLIKIERTNKESSAILLEYKTKNIDGEFFVRYNGKKSLSDYSPSGEDNLPYATANGMPAWFTLNIRLAYNLTKQIRINAGCENITDNRYRVFASGINAPGRNFILSLRYKF